MMLRRQCLSIMGEETQLDLFAAKTCPFSHRVKMALVHKQIRYNTRDVDLANKPAELMKASPNGKVPALIWKGKHSVYESLVCLEFLDDAYPLAEVAIMPEATQERALARIANGLVEGTIVPAWNASMRSDDAGERERHFCVFVDGMRTWVRLGFQRSAEGPYFFGASPTVVDFALFPFLYRMPALTHYRKFMVPTTGDDAVVRLESWRLAMMNLSAAKKTAPKMDAIIAVYSQYGEEVPKQESVVDGFFSSFTSAAADLSAAVKQKL